MHLKKSMLILLTLGTFASCTKVVTEKQSTATQDNRMTKNSSVSVKEVRDGDIKLQFMTRSHVAMMIESGALKDARPELLEDDTQAAAEEELFFGYPIDLLGTQHVFGGVITKVSNKVDEDLGSLKLTDLTPVHVTTKITQIEGYPFLAINGCVNACDEYSQQPQIMLFPIIGLDSENKQIIVDLSEIGQELNLVQMMDPKGEYTKLKTRSSKTTTLDYSLTTLVFDVATKMIPTDREDEDTTAPETEFVVRWYLKLGADFNPAFAVRNPVKEVGFFKTERAKETKIMRHSITAGKPIHYYVKNVPADYQKMVKASLDHWNAEFKTIIGREVLTYEFIPAGDPKNEAIVTGDIRYNVIEWDLNNVASYGGLGPSVANQFTGEIFSSNVLLQGPKIVEMYSKWFKASEGYRSLMAQGRDIEAEKLLKDFANGVKREEEKAKAISYEVKLGDLPMTVHSQRPELHDPILKGLFELVPEGVTFEKYMEGYFQEMIEHELGHNLGLRHNFRGNLGSNESRTRGSVSRSIMEYLGRGFRYLNDIGLYDRMAISYGYKGVAPTHADWFCTDEDQGLDAKSILVKSPECSKSDATSDPFAYWQGRLDRALDVMVRPTTTRAPILTIAHIDSEVKDMASAFAGYALSAEKTADSWTNFFGKADRPENKSEIKAYVMNTLQSKLCSPEIADAIAMKETPEAVKATQDSYDALVKMINETVTKLGLLKEKEGICK